MTRRMMLDSGAFTVWTQGAVINLEDYLAYCQEFPAVTNYVNLDVIPGEANNRRSLTPDAIEASCKEGWKNYRRMIEHLPMDKVIPVFHQNDHIKWLEKYLDFGVQYIGISPANDQATPAKLKWLKGLLPHLFTKAGKPVVKTHGFAVTSYDLMQFMDWYSVDSASWKLTAAWGGIYLPRRHGSKWDYARPPFQVAVSPMAPSRHKLQFHIDSMTPIVRRMVLQFLEEMGIPLGTHKVIKVDHGYKVNLALGEIWHDRKRGEIIRPKIVGVANNFETRCIFNAKFMRKVAAVMPIRHLYFAGATMPYELEYKMGNRLLSYHEIKTDRGKAILSKHLRTMERRVQHEH